MRTLWFLLAALFVTTGTARAARALEVVPTSLDFGDVEVGSAAAPRTFQLRRVQGNNITVNALVPDGGPDCAAFAVTPERALPTTVSNTQPLDVTVVFTPAAA